jgi:hypothetical protein
MTGWLPTTRVHFVYTAGGPQERLKSGPRRVWALSFGHREDHTPTHDYEPTREAAMAAFAKSWRRE